MTRLLVTNDDGIDAPGLRALVRALADAGHEVVVAAPARQYSGASAAILVDGEADEVEVAERQVPGAVAAWAIGAAPAMCVLLAQWGRFGPAPEAVVSGINDGPNTGRVLLHSGTVGAALTAGVAGWRALAVSLDVGRSPAALHWAPAAAVAIGLLPVLLGEPEGTVLNLNVPNTAGPHRLVEAPLDTGGIVSTSEAGAEIDEEAVRLAVGRRGPEGTDSHLLQEGLATVTAIVPPAAVRLRTSLR